MRAANSLQIWQQPGLGKPEFGYFCLRDLTISMKDEYQTLWYSYISRPDNNKLLAYSMFQHSISLENYILQNSLKERRHLTKLRISAHSLAIKTGRYSKPKIPVVSRLCQHCNQGAIEIEYHMVMECPVYSLERKELLDQLSDFCTIPIDNKYETFIILMSYANGDNEIAKCVCDLLKKMFWKETVNQCWADMRHCGLSEVCGKH